MRITSWIPKATNTHTEYVILISLPLQKIVTQTLRKARYTLRRYKLPPSSEWCNCIQAELELQTVCGGSTFARNACLKSRFSTVPKPTRL